MKRFAGVLVAVALVAAACANDGKTPSSRDDITVLVGQDLGLGQMDRVIPGFSVGVCKATVDGGVATISERHLVGDEAGAGHRIVIDFNGQIPVVVEVPASPPVASCQALKTDATSRYVASGSTTMSPTAVLASRISARQSSITSAPAAPAAAMPKSVR